MPLDIQELIHETEEEIIENLTAEQRLRIIRRTPPEIRRELMKEVSLEERLHGLDPVEVLRVLAPSDMVRGLNAEQKRTLKTLLDRSEDLD